MTRPRRSTAAIVNRIVLVLLTAVIVLSLVLEGVV
jgi:hypothetical protein